MNGHTPLKETLNVQHISLILSKGKMHMNVKYSEDLVLSYGKGHHSVKARKIARPCLSIHQSVIAFYRFSFSI